MRVNVGGDQVERVGRVVDPRTERPLKTSHLVFKELHRVDKTGFFGVGRVRFNYGGKKDEFLFFSVGCHRFRIPPRGRKEYDLDQGALDAGDKKSIVKTRAFA